MVMAVAAVKELEMSEQVLCFAAELLRSGDSWPLVTDPEIVNFYMDKVLSGDLLHYRPRDEVETDPSWKQVIPYAVLRCGEWLYCYRRSSKGNEARLHGLISIGVGGHINPCDGEGGGGYATYDNGFWRELQEEVGLTPGGVAGWEIVGLIYDGSNEVGRVHFGVVHVIDIYPDIAVDIDGLWLRAETCCREVDNFENWSKLILESGLLS